MLKVLSPGIAYHGWRINVMAEEQEFFFCCYHPELPDYSNDGMAYATVRDAWIAACQFVDREIAIQALLSILSEWFVTNKITEDEYWNLSNFE